MVVPQSPLAMLSCSTTNLVVLCYQFYFRVYQNAKKNHEKHEGNLTESVTRKVTALKQETKQQKMTVASSIKLHVA